MDVAAGGSWFWVLVDGTASAHYYTDFVKSLAVEVVNYFHFFIQRTQISVLTLNGLLDYLRAFITK